MPDWVVRHCPSARVSLVTDSPGLQADAVKEGFGAAWLPCAMGDSDEGLQRVADVPLVAGPQMWILTHVDVRTNARIRVFRDFMLEFFKGQVALMQGQDIRRAAGQD